MDDVCPLLGNQPPATRLLKHLPGYADEAVNLLFSVHDLNNNRKVFRETENLRCVDPASSAVTFDTPQHCGTRQSKFTCPSHKCFIQRLVAEPVKLADEDTQELALASEFHKHIPLRSQQFSNHSAEPCGSQSAVCSCPSL